MTLDVVALIAGLVVLTLGADTLVRGASSLALHLGLTPLVIGLTVVAFGTSAPEMLVSVGGSLRGHGDIAVGNVMGSNIFNIGLILAFAAIITPIAIKLTILKLDVPLLFCVSLGAIWVLHDGHVSRAEGTVLLVILFVYTVFSVRLARRQVAEEVASQFELSIPRPTPSILRDSMYIVVGLGLLMLGSRWLIASATNMARAFHVSEAVLGLTIVAAGTSMPELATSLVAAVRRRPDMVVGNILGSNLFNLLGILGLAAVLRPLEAPAIRAVDLWAMLLFVVLMIPLFWTGRKLQRWEGALLLAGYVAYIAFRWPPG